MDPPRAPGKCRMRLAGPEDGHGGTDGLSELLEAAGYYRKRVDLIWYGMVWYGTVRYGMVGYGMVRYGTVRYGTVG